VSRYNSLFCAAISVSRFSLHFPANSLSNMLVRRGLPRSPSAEPHALTIGNFDGVHLGHQAILGEVRRAAAALHCTTAVVTFEPHPREFFAPHAAPTRLTSLREKIELLDTHGIGRAQICHFNRAFASLSADDFIERVLVRGLNARWVMIGEDFRFGAKRSGDFDYLHAAGKRHGFEVHALPDVTQKDARGHEFRVSSSALREVLSAGDVERAATLLGRPYSISGRVMHGDKLGRTLGFPTANVQMRHNRPPLTGIYAVRVSGIDAAGQVNSTSLLDAVASVGVRPTVTDSGEMRLEVFLFDFSADIYGKHIRVDFLKKIRDEEKYKDLETLKRQIEQDAQDARSFLANARATRHAIIE
jgi:riboflavin kinase / FMN adenylyltransferase